MSKSKILLINPPQSCDISLKVNNLKFPLGLLYLGNYLEQRDCSVRIIDCPVFYKKRRQISNHLTKVGLFPDEITNAIKQFNPDVIGVSCAYTAYEQDSFEIISLIRALEKKMGKRFLIVVGGAHTSSNPQNVLRNDQIDIAVMGEGEETLYEIVNAYKNNLSLNKINGTAIKINGNVKINNPREYIRDLDNLRPAWHLIDMKIYFNHPDNSRVTLRSPSVDILTSRGCPANCVFCSIHTVWGRKWRSESCKKVVDEIEFLVKKYNVKQFRIQDDNFTLNKERVLDICNEIKKRKLDIKWDTPNGIAFWALDEEILLAMKNAGCYRITFGIESACKKTQGYVRKIVDLEKINRLINFCHKIGLWVCSTFIVGFPYETKKDINETEKYILSSKINFPFIYIAQPLSGTDLHKDFVKENLLSKTMSSSNIAKTQYKTLYFNGIELNKIRNDLVKKFYIKKIFSYLNPFSFYREFLSKIKNKEDLVYLAKNITVLVSG